MDTIFIYFCSYLHFIFTYCFFVVENHELCSYFKCEDSMVKVKLEIMFLFFRSFFSGMRGKHSCEITKKTLHKLWSSLEIDVGNLAISEIFYTFFDHLITFKFSGKHFNFSAPFIHVFKNFMFIEFHGNDLSSVSEIP